MSYFYKFQSTIVVSITMCNFLATCIKDFIFETFCLKVSFIEKQNPLWCFSSMCVHTKNSDKTGQTLNFFALDHGLRTPNEAFFHRNPKLLGLGRYILGDLGYFRPIYQHPFWYCNSLVHVFH